MNFLVFLTKFIFNYLKFFIFFSSVFLFSENKDQKKTILQGFLSHMSSSSDLFLIPEDSKKINFCKDSELYDHLKIFSSMSLKLEGFFKFKGKRSCFVTLSIDVLKTDMTFPFFVGVLRFKKNNFFLERNGKKIKEIQRPIKSLSKFIGKKVLLEIISYPSKNKQQAEFITRLFHLKA